jgi:hypothetical protein
LRHQALCLAVPNDPPLRTDAVLFSSTAYYIYNLQRHEPNSTPPEAFRARLRHVRVVHQSLRGTAVA